MPARNTPLRYGAVAMTLHWAIAALILLNIYIGLSLDDYPRGPALLAAIQFHESVGLTVLWLSVLRVVWRLFNPVPTLPAGMPRALKGAAHVSHFLLYLLILIVPLSGWIFASASLRGLAIHYFGTFVWPFFPGFSGLDIPTKRQMHEVFESVHITLAWSLIVLLTVHVSAALYHQFWQRDDVFVRMLPGTKVKEPA